MNLPANCFTAYANAVYGEKAKTCDCCDRECYEGHNIPDRHFHCCRCHAESALAYGVAVDQCELCVHEKDCRCADCEATRVDDAYEQFRDAV